MLVEKLALKFLNPCLDHHHFRRVLMGIHRLALQGQVDHKLYGLAGFVGDFRGDLDLVLHRLQ